MFGYKLIKKKEYEMLTRCYQVDQRVAELNRWLNPWREIYGNVFRYLLFGNTSVEIAREFILQDLIKLGHKIHSPQSMQNVVEKGR